MKNYPPEFKADAVALYESRPAAIRSVAADLGINPETLRNWVRAAGVSRPRGRRTQEPAQPPAPLEAENAALRKKVRELEEEREILRKAATYFARGDALVNRFQCVADLQRRYGVKRLCTILGVSRSSFYYWRRTATDRAARQVADARLAARIRGQGPIDHGARLGIDVDVVRRGPDQKGFAIIPRRRGMERAFGWLMHHRRLARDYETHPHRSEAMIRVAMIDLMSRRLTRQSTPNWKNACGPSESSPNPAAKPSQRCERMHHPTITREGATVTEPDAVDLIHLEDADGNRCIIRVTGRYQPGVLTGHDVLRADVLASADFLDARLELFLFQQDLDAWQRDLAQLAPGADASIGGDRGLSLVFHMHEDRSLSVTVDDPDRLTAALSLRPQETWIPEHQQRLKHIREIWPTEVVETAPMAYEWSPSRRP